MQTLPTAGSTNAPYVPVTQGDEVPSRTPQVRRRLQGWLRSPSSLSLLVVVGITVFVFIELRPDLLFSSTYDVGGDNAAHILAPYFFIHNLLPHGQLSGWDPQWFNGFPLYVFYFPLPAVFVAILSAFFNYAVAFKLVTVAGSLALPGAAYLFGRLTGLARPVPEFLAIAMLPYLFNTSYTIDGGNIASTMAGEFSFSLAVAFGLVFLGTFVRALRTGRQRWLPAIFFVLTLLCHVVPALFCAGTAVVMTVMFFQRRSLWILVSVGVVGGLLSAFWLVPFGAYLRYSSSMGYTRVPGLFHQIFPVTAMLPVLCFALIGAVFAVVRRQRVMCALTIAAVGSAGAFQLLPSGLVYNGRWLPFWFLTTALLGGYGLCETLHLGYLTINFSRWFATTAPITAAFVVVLLICSWLGVLPVLNVPSANRNFVTSWVSWNYSGYQAKPGWPQYQNIIAMLDRATNEHGCGRLDYEYSPNVQNFFGSPLVPMAFPLFTNGCIDVAEGLYYESSTSTPFHFLDQAELSIQASNPVVGIPYQNLNVADGIRHLQLQGIKYFLANSPQVERDASIDPDLAQVGSTPATPSIVDGATTTTTTPATWVLYEIRDSSIVTPLHYLPVVEQNMPKTQWLSTAISWYQDEQYWPVRIASSGPAAWPAAKPGALVAPSSAIKLRTTTTVSKVTTTNSTLSFHVSTIGVPVSVAIPYFPNWHVTGATGPYESTPNLMIVVPTQHDVTLTYGTTPVDIVAKAATVLGLVGLVGIRHDLTPIAPLEPADPLATSIDPNGLASDEDDDATDPANNRDSGSDDDRDDIDDQDGSWS